MENWVRAWREGVAPLLPLRGLEALAAALEADDPALIQGGTLEADGPVTVGRPEPKVCGACAVAYAIWKGRGIGDVAGLHQAFAAACLDASDRMGEPGGVSWLLRWVDENPRAEVRAALLPEVQAEIARRAA